MMRGHHAWLTGVMATLICVKRLTLQIVACAATTAEYQCRDLPLR